MALDAYTEGWNDHIQYLQDQREAGNAGTGLTSLGGLLFLFGGLAVFSVVSAAYQYGWPHLGHPFAERALAVGLLCLVASYLSFEGATIRRNRAQADFNKKWNGRRP